MTRSRVTINQNIESKIKVIDKGLLVEHSANAQYCSIVVFEQQLITVNFKLCLRRCWVCHESKSRIFFEC